MGLHPVFTLMPTCQHLRLVPTESDLAHIKALLWELREEDDNTPEDVEEYILDILGKHKSWPGRIFRAECTKLNIACVLTESVVISEETPLPILVVNKDRLIQCDQREENPCFPNKALESWVLDGLSSI
ncbi:MAG: hypothetical protein QG620_86 [Patescibacteria group bacterium]|nr:hypothetical protein [Patescibacteria group bacterium]